VQISLLYGAEEFTKFHFKVTHTHSARQKLARKCDVSKVRKVKPNSQSAASKS